MGPPLRRRTHHPGRRWAASLRAPCRATPCPRSRDRFRLHLPFAGKPATRSLVPLTVAQTESLTRNSIQLPTNATDDRQAWPEPLSAPATRHPARQCGRLHRTQRRQLTLLTERPLQRPHRPREGRDDQPSPAISEALAPRRLKQAQRVRPARRPHGRGRK